jgi:hypothetical protein
MRIDLLEKWLKEYPYGYCNGINFQTCRANKNTNCPYCASNVHCSNGNAAIDYYRELLRFMRMKPRRARKVTIMFAETLPSILKGLDAEIHERKNVGGQAMRMIYLAHPFGGEMKNVDKAEKLIKELLHKHPACTFYSPLHATGFFYSQLTYLDGMEHCFEALSRCDELWLCGEWRDSRGCNMEYAGFVGGGTK